MEEERTRSWLAIWGVGFSIVLIGLYLVWTFTSLIPRVGSATKLATVYEVKLGDEKQYAFSLKNREGKTFFCSAFAPNRPYIYEDGDRLIILEYDSKKETYCYDLHYLYFCPAERKLFLNPFTKVEKVDVEKLETGFKAAEAYEIDFNTEDKYFWKVKDNEGKVILSDYSETVPRFEGNEELIMVQYTKDNVEMTKDFDIKRSKMYDE